jgi:two-component system nitrogen regulation response regulator GlnG
MSVRSSVFSVLLLSADPDVHHQFKEVFKDASVVSAKDVATIPKEAAKRTYDAVIVESKSGAVKELARLPHAVDPNITLVVTGSRQVLRRTSRQMLELRNGALSSHTGNGWLPSLEDYLESKMGDFVKGMRNGSASNLHPILISAVERPLIELALKETKGNQIQAAELLGLNRNTLRKKIHDLHISIRRTKVARTA